MPARTPAPRALRHAAAALWLSATLAAALAAGPVAPALAGLAMPEAIVSYRMRVRYDPVTHQARGAATIAWLNTSGESVPDLQLHLYMNAFRNAKTSYMRENEDAEGVLRALDKHWGWIDVTRLTLANGTDLTKQLQFIAPDDSNAADRSVARVVLPKPVAPGERVQFTVEFEEQFPRCVDRCGWAKDFVMAGQWFPKLGVYEPAGRNGRARGGWNCHQFHINTEFFSEFGDYDVMITVPKGWKLGGTGARLLSHDNVDGTVTERWAQRGVHDFAWTASPRFVVTERTFVASREISAAEVESTARMLGRPVEDVRLPDVKVTLLTFPDEHDAIERHIRALFAAIHYYGLWYGPYPYDQFTLLVAPRDAALVNGMEYPTFVTGWRSFGAPPEAEWFESTAVHEFGHQYWYGMLASNEFEESWLDEGINSYSEAKVMDHAYGPLVRTIGFGDVRVPGVSWLDLGPPLFGIYGTPSRISNLASMRRRFESLPATDAIVRNAWEYWDSNTYDVDSYQRPAVMLATLERLIGSPTWARVMRAYADNYRFKHPTSRDFLATVNRITGQDWSWYFDQFVWGNRRLDYEVAKISSDEIAEEPGVYERNGQRVTKNARDLEREEKERDQAEKRAEKAKAAADSAKKGGAKGAAKTAAKTEEPDTTRYRSEVRVRRLGDGVAPVELVVYFSDHTVAHETWDGRYQWARFVYEKRARVDSAMVDPGDKLLLDVNRVNNFRARKANAVAAERWTVHWMLWVQNFLQLLGWLA